MRPHVLLTYDYPPMSGGIARWMGEIAARYPPGELVVSTGTIGEVADTARETTRPNPVLRTAVNAHRLRTVPGWVRWTGHTLGVVRTHRPEFMWCGQLRPAAYPAKWIERFTGIPYGVVVHGTDLLLLRERVHSARDRVRTRALLRPASAIVANSTYTGALCTKVLQEFDLGAQADRLRVIPLGTDPEWFRPDISPHLLQQRFDLPDGRWLVTVARLMEHKGIDTAIRAVAQLAGEFSDLQYLVVGAGPFRHALEALAQDLLVSDRVHFVGQVPDDLLPQALNLAEVYLAPSRELSASVEGFGIAIAEASACGLPVVAARSGGIADAVRDGETGVLVDPLDPAAFAGALRTFLNDDSYRREVGLAGRRAVETFFNWDRVVSAMRELGHACAGRAGSAGRRRGARR